MDNNNFETDMNGGFEPDMNNGYAPNMNNGYAPDMNNGYAPDMNNGYAPDMNNGYAPNMNNGYAPNMNGGYGVPPMQPMKPVQVKKRRKTGAVVLCIFAAILLVADLFFVSMKTGILSKGIIKSIMAQLSEQIREEAIKELSIENFDESMDEAMDEVMDNFAGYVSDYLLEGKMPEKENIKNDMETVFDKVVDEYTNVVLDEIEKDGGEISIEEIENTDAFKGLEDLLGSDEYDNVLEGIKGNLGNTIVVNDDTKETIKNEILSGANQIKEEKLDEFVDNVYKEMDQFKDEIKSETNDVPIDQILIGINSFVETMIIALSVIIVLFIVIAFIIDRDLYLSFRGMFPTLLVPGLFVLIPTLLLKVLIDFIIARGTNDVEVQKMLTIISEKAIMPFIIASGIAIIVAIVCKVISVILNKRTVVEE